VLREAEMPWSLRDRHEPYLILGGLLIGAALFISAYASLRSPLVSVFTVLFLVSGALFSEAFFADKPLLYVLGSIILAITVGGCVLAPDIFIVPSALCAIAGPMLVAKGLRVLGSKRVMP